MVCEKAPPQFWGEPIQTRPMRRVSYLDVHVVDLTWSLVAAETLRKKKGNDLVPGSFYGQIVLGPMRTFGAKLATSLYDSNIQINFQPKNRQEVRAV